MNSDTYINHPRWCILISGGTTRCTYCNKTWDTNDMDPPGCIVRRANADE